MATATKAATSKAAPKDDGEKKARNAPQIGLLKEVGEVFPDEPAGGGYQIGTDAIMETLRAVAEHPGKVFEVVHYATKNGSEANPGGARKLVQKFLDGKLVAPEIEGGYFELEYRSARYDGGGRDGSVMLAKFVTE
jgi:hypothetical protein